MIYVELWTLVILEATLIATVTRFNSDVQYLLAIFPKSFVHLNVFNEHASGCPAHVLKSPLQARSKTTKW